MFARGDVAAKVTADIYYRRSTGAVRTEVRTRVKSPTFRNTRYMNGVLVYIASTYFSHGAQRTGVR